MEDSDSMPVVEVNEQSITKSTFHKYKDTAWKKGKIAFALFIIYILLSTDVFIDQILSKCSSAVDGQVPTTTGVIIQAICLIIGFILIDILVDNEVI